MSSYPFDPSGIWGAQAANSYASYGPTQSNRFPSVTGRDSFTRSDGSRKNADYANAAGYSGMPYFPGGGYGMMNPFMMSAMYSPYGMTSMGAYSGYPLSSGESFSAAAVGQSTPSTPVSPMTASTSANPQAFEAGVVNYNGVKINKSGFTDDQLKQVEKTVDLMAADPDGQKLLNKFKEGGGEIKFDSSTGNIAYSSGNDIAFGTGSFSDTGYTLEVFGHELTHSVTQGDGNSKNEESLGSTLGRTIRNRYENQPYTPQDQKESYNGGFESAKNNNPAYKDLPENTHVFNSLGQLGVNFDFNPDPSVPWT